MEMPPRRRPHSSTGFLGVQLRPSGRWAAEITRGGDRLWLGTFETPELAACAYDAMVWRLDGPRGPLNFPEVQSREEADFLTPAFEVVRHDEERAVRREYMRMAVCQADEVAMAAYRAAHPDHIAAELEYYAVLAAQQVTATASAAAAGAPSSAGPSTAAADLSTEMDTDFWEDLIREVDGESEDDGFWDDKIVEW